MFNIITKVKKNGP